MRAFGLVAALCLMAGCAYVGEPLPPALNVPRPIPALTVEQVGSRVLVHFPLPVETTEALPVEIRAIEVQAEWPGGAETLTATRDAQEASTATITATASAPAKPWIGQTVALKARTQSRQEKWSGWSPVAVIKVEEPVAKPADVKAEAVAGGVRVSWRGQAKAGMRIERRTGTAPRFTDGGTAAPGSDAWIDTQARFGEQQHYRLTAVSASGPARSEPVEASVLPVDTFPPSVPTKLAAVTGLGSVELTWDRPPETDLAGFAVYRATGGGAFTRLNPEPSPAATFSDRTVQAGVAYRYAVTSVDRTGNESARSEPVEITAPN